MINRNTVSKAISGKQVLIRNMYMKENFSHSFLQSSYKKRCSSINCVFKKKDVTKK